MEKARLNLNKLNKLNNSLSKLNNKRNKLISRINIRLSHIEAIRSNNISGAIRRPISGAITLTSSGVIRSKLLECNMDGNSPSNSSSLSPLGDGLNGAAVNLDNPNLI